MRNCPSESPASASGFSFSNAFEFTNLAEVKELRSSAYANSLIETISLTLGSNGSVADVRKLLDELEAKLNQDQEKATNEWNTLRNELNGKIEKLDGEIASLNKRLAEDRSELAEKEKLKLQSEANIQQYKSQKSSNLASLAENETRRAKDRAQYQTSVSEHGTVIEAISAVVKELQNLIGSISGKDKPAHVEDIAAETRDRAFAAAKKSFVQITKDETNALLLAQLATSADQDALNKLIALLGDIKLAAEKSLNHDEDFEKNSKTLYDKLNSDLNADNELLNKNIEDQNKNLKVYIDRINELNTNIANNQKLLEEKTAERAQTIKFRDEKQAQYDQDKKEREREIEVIKKLKGIVDSRLKNMSAFLKEKTGAF